MVRYSADHKAQSRATLVATAASLFRQHGFSGVGIEELCQSAGFTRGVFYAHFASKADLLKAVLAGAHDFVRRLKARGATTERTLRLEGLEVARDYLNPENRDAVLGGCSLAALAMDTARADQDTQRAYSEAVEQVIAEWGRAGVSKPEAGAALAMCIGGLLIHSACGDQRVGRQVAQAARRELNRLLGEG